VTLAGTAPPSWRTLVHQWMGDADTEAELVLSRSPITYVDRIRAPLQGSSIGPCTQSQAWWYGCQLAPRGVDIRLPRRFLSRSEPPMP
jgi:hypothetical protein